MCQNCGRLVPPRFLNVWFDQDGSGVCSAERGRFTAANCAAHIQENRQRAIAQATLTLHPVPSPESPDESFSSYEPGVNDPPSSPPPEIDWGFEGSSLDILRSMLEIAESPPSQDKRREILGAAMQKLDDCKEQMPERCYLDVANELKKVYDIC